MFPSSAYLHPGNAFNGPAERALSSSRVMYVQKTSSAECVGPRAERARLVNAYKVSFGLLSTCRTCFFFRCQRIFSRKSTLPRNGCLLVCDINLALTKPVPHGITDHISAKESGLPLSRNLLLRKSSNSTSCAASAVVGRRLGKCV
jgi:hypothetical protein